LKSTYIADTGLLIALLNPHDLHHDWAKVEAKRCSTGFITCEAVISETIYLLRKSKKAKDAVIAMIESGWMNIVPVLPEMRVGVIRVLETYHPLADYADACLVALHEQYGATVYTTDRRDFTVYRTRSGDLVTAIFPEKVAK